MSISPHVLSKHKGDRVVLKSFIKSHFIDKIEYLYLFLQGKPLNFLQIMYTLYIFGYIHILHFFFSFLFYNLTNNYINTSSNVRNPYLLGVYN